MKTKIFTLLAGSLLAFSGMAQEVNPCGTNEALENLHKQFPHMKTEYESAQLLRNSQVINDSENGVAKKSDTNYVVAVVFHIMHEYGSENVSDSEIYSLMEELNEDYSATNAGLSAIIPMFDTLVADMGIEFRLAALDPFGNCTNGIEHIYSHETNNGETVSKINQWDRSHYMNVWVAETPSTGGSVQGTLLGYATFPAGTDGSQFWTDGIMLRATTTVNTETLTHEAGHYFGLAHPFQGVAEGGIGDPTDCGDDGVLDTPPTEGQFGCNLSLPTCDTALAELPFSNAQNWMDYANCAAMFTKGQHAVTSNTLVGISGQRNVLWKDTTLMEAGVLNMTMPQTALTVPLCAPIADFHSDDRTVCLGSNVSFQDASWNAVIDDHAWTFEDGTPSTSTALNPSVTFTTGGWKQVSLTVSNAAGSDTRSVKYIFVSEDYPQNYGPTTFNMESPTSAGTGTNLFVVQNPELNHGEFNVVNNYGYDGSKAFKLNTFKDVSQADDYTADWFYNLRLGGSVDNLITPSMDLRNTSAITVSFKYAYATNATVSADITEELRVFTTRNCGETWTPKVITVGGVSAGTTITGDEIVTAGYASNSDFAPTTNTMWKEGTFTYIPTAQDRLTRIKFEFTASDLASNLYIDNISVNGVLGVVDAELINLQLSVFPNPTNGEAISVNYNAQDEPTEFTLRDTQGKIIAQQVITATNTSVTQKLDNTQNLPSALYFLEVKTGDHSTTKKVVVL
jgi:PKD repeat protein